MNSHSNHQHVRTGSAVKVDGSSSHRARLTMRPKTAHSMGTRQKYGAPRKSAENKGQGDIDTTDEVRYLNRSFSIMSVTPRPRPKTATPRPTSGHTTGNVHRKLSYSSQRRFSVDRKQKQRRNSQDSSTSCKQWRIRALLTAEDIAFWDVVSNEDEMQARIHSFYNKLVECCNSGNGSLQKLPKIGHIQVDSLRRGVLIDFVCDSESNVKHLQELYRTTELVDLFNELLITDKFLWDQQIIRVELKVSIEEEQFRNARSMSSSTNRKRSLLSVSSTDDDDTQECDELEAECIRALRTFSAELSEFLSDLKQRYARLEQQMDNLLFALQMATPSSHDPCRTLAKVIDCHAHLKKSPSVGKSVRTDLVRELMTIINLIRIKTNESRYHITVAMEYVRSADRKEHLVTCQQRAAGISEMLQVDYDFSSLDGDTRVPVSRMKSSLFPGLIHFVPTLLTKASELHTSIDDHL